MRIGRWGLRLLRDAGRALRRPLTRRLLGVLLLLWLLDQAIYFATETQWQSAAGFGAVWQARFLAEIVLFSGAFGLTFLFSLLLWPLVALPASAPKLPSQYAWLERRLRVLNRFDGRVARLLIFIGALWNGLQAAAHWPQWMLFWHGENWGVRAPFWDADVAFWIFRLPFWNLLLHILQRALLIVLFCGFFLALGRGAARFLSRSPALPRRALRGLILLGIAFFVVRALQFSLMPFGEMATLEADAAWNARVPAWWLGTLLNLWPVVVLCSLLLRGRGPHRVLLFGIGAAFLAPPVLLFLLAQNERLFGIDGTFVEASRTATQQAWGLSDLEITEWNSVDAVRTVPQKAEWLQQLDFKEETPVAKTGAAISINTSLQRVLWAWRLRNFNLIGGARYFTPRRSFEQQRAALAPFLWPGGEVRRVVIGRQNFWLQELLVVSDNFPGAAHETLDLNGQDHNINTVRPAALMVFEEQSGTTKFYALQETPDEITSAWQRALPVLILPLEKLSSELKSERRYPAELLKRQAHQLSEIAGADWHLAQQIGASDMESVQEPILTRFNSTTNLQIALCGDVRGENLAALLSARCDSFGKLSLLRFDVPESQIAPLDSGLSGPNVLAERVEGALPEETIVQDEKPLTRRLWFGGLVRPVAFEKRVWLWQPLWRKRAGGNKNAGYVVADAAWRDGPIGVGHDAIAALNDWARLAKLWNHADATQRDENFAARLHVLLEPKKARDEAQIADSIQRAAALHGAAARAEKTNRAVAARLRQDEGKILQKLQKLAPVATPSPAPAD